MTKLPNLELESKLAGAFKFTAVQLDSEGNPREETRRVLADWFPNLITDGGLDRMGTVADYAGWCQVGSGSTAPSVSDTGLAARIAGTNTLQASVTGAQASAPYYVKNIKTFRFAIGVATGNLSEVGIGWTTTGSLFSRALILDGAGSPTTITVLSTEALDVSYELRMYPPTVDTSGTIVLAGVTYDWIGRASLVTSYGGGAWLPGIYHAGYAPYGMTLYSGAIGAITSYPAGSASAGSAGVASSYTAGSFYRDITFSFSLTQGNVSGGALAARFTAGWGTYQLGFTPAIPKDNTKTLSLVIRHSWARKTLP
jgi:hypothetical protein